MELLEDGRLILSKDEATIVCREYHKRYHRYNRKIIIIKDRLSRILLENSWSRYLRNQLVKSQQRVRELEKWNEVYELLFRNKRVKNNAKEAT